MPDLAFPDRPSLAPQESVSVVRVVPRQPLAAIQQLLQLSIHDVVNDASRKRLVADFYRITRRLENEAWLRRRELEQDGEAWFGSGL
jgi:hypothetical protein